MSSVIIAGDTSGTVTISAPAVAGTPTLTLPTTSGTIVATSGSYVPTTQLGSGTASASNYLRGDQSWATISSGGMTLLGTITPTAANSISLGGLNLTNYKALFVVLTSVTSAAADNFYMNSTSVASGIGFYTSFAVSGMAWVDLATGTGGGGYQYGTSGGTYGAGGLTTISTATTTIYFRFTGAYTFTATGSIKVYGVA